MTNLPAESQPAKTGDVKSEMIRIFLPYALAVLIQLPMLMLYFRTLWARPHYQPFSIAILAVAALALYRWPFGNTQPFHRSIVSDILMVLGLGFAFLGMLFVEPWFAALSAMLLISSLFARTIDREGETTLWACSLPLYVYLILPNGIDTNLITKLQLYSANYTSRLLDLIGLGHHMDGTVINVPSMKEYGIEQACSGVQSFFTLLFVAVVFIVMSRRINIPTLGIGVLSILAAVTCFVLRMTLFTTGIFNEIFLIAGAGFILLTLLGFRAAALILSAVFWAVFMNTIRILVIPLSDYFLQIDLSSGLSHSFLGYATLALGILMLFSTDQFLFFMFGPVEETSGESGPFGRVITKFWNGILSGEKTEEESESRRKARGYQPIAKTGQTLIWTLAGLTIAFGLWEFVDVQRSYRTDLKIRFFDSDMLVDFDQNDMPESIDGWKKIRYMPEERSSGSDLGQRSDSWQFANVGAASNTQTMTYSTVASFDQTFPGWHELTTCYKNVGWRLVSRKKRSPSHLVDGESSDKWTYIEANFERRGEKGYLLFSHFDAFGEGIEAPESWGTLNSFFIRARNRLSHRIRAQLFRGEAYQTQVFATSFTDFSPELKEEIGLRFLKIRGHMKDRFMAKQAGESTTETETESPAVADAG
ncbi:MAG: exosortase U [Mariniblastus sp.]